MQAYVTAFVVLEPAGPRRACSDQLLTGIIVIGIHHITERHASKAARCFPVASRESKEEPALGWLLSFAWVVRQSTQSMPYGKNGKLYRRSQSIHEKMQSPSPSVILAELIKLT